jgi:peroxiredoxin
MSSSRLKRAFVMPFFGLLGVVFVHSIGSFVATGLAAVWLGPAIVAGSFFAFMGWMMLSGAPRTSERVPGLLAAGAGGVAVAITGAATGTTPAVLPLTYAVGGFAGLVVYVFWYSDLGREKSAALRVGETLPDFLVDTESGQRVSSLALRGQPVVWLFFRGNWCPLCMAQIKEVVARYKEIEARGARVVLVSPQSHEHTRELAKRFDVPFRFFVDRDGRAARSLGIFHEGGVPLGMPGYGADTVFPTVIVTDADGRILLADETDNYRVRPEPETFLAALDAASATAR